jgi:hypothetical protein
MRGIVSVLGTLPEAGYSVQGTELRDAILAWVASQEAHLLHGSDGYQECDAVLKDGRHVVLDRKYREAASKDGYAAMRTWKGSFHYALRCVASDLCFLGGAPLGEVTTDNGIEVCGPPPENLSFSDLAALIDRAVPEKLRDLYVELADRKIEGERYLVRMQEWRRKNLATIYEALRQARHGKNFPFSDAELPIQSYRAVNLALVDEPNMVVRVDIHF